MQKKGFLIFTLLFFGIIFINFVSAQYYGSSLSNLLSSIDASTMILLLVLIISFAFINFSLSKSVFRDNKAIAGIIAFSISLGIIYWINSYGVGYYGIDIEGIFYDLSYNLGFSGDFLYTIIPLILLVGTIYFIWKFKISKVSLVLGILLIIASFTDFIYEKGIVLIIGIILVIVGFWFSKKSKNIRKYLKHKREFIKKHDKKAWESWGESLWKRNKN
tara:strand:+ start:122 stop:775 length:654 start_codon:yes stop_codon:yes gene_type:complete